MFITENKNIEEPPPNEAPIQKKNNQYKLRSQGPVPEQEMTKKKVKECLLRKLTLPVSQVSNKFGDDTTKKTLP